MIVLAPNHIFNCHSCELLLHNVTKKNVEFKDGKCPQCHTVIRDTDVRSASTSASIDTLKLFPPHGMSFKNELGAEVTIKYPRGRELELFTELQRQLQEWIGPIANAQQAKRAPQGPGGDFASSVMHAARTAPKIRVDEHGTIIIEESDGPPEAAKD